MTTPERQAPERQATDDQARDDQAGHAAASPLDAPSLTKSERWRRGTQLSDGSKLYWWREMIIVVVVYVIYESVRNISKSKPGPAFENAKRIISWQETLGIYHEKSIQDWAIQYTPLIVVSNYFYGTAYILVTIGTLVWLYRKRPESYRLWRTTLAVGTLIGLIGFATFPLMPPRLLDLLGDGHHVYGYVDTLVKFPTFWSFDSPTMKSISNQFAAMPSLHCGWSFWTFAALFPLVRTTRSKVLVALYPIATVAVVVVTGNHYFLDAVGGLVIFVLGYGVARLASYVRIAVQRRQADPDSAMATP